MHYSFLLINSEEMKSLASLDMASKASSSKSKSDLVILAKVSASFSPINGDSPDSLQTKKNISN